MATEPHQLGVGESSGVVHDRHEVIALFVCPNCGSYYGSSSIGHLEDQMSFNLAHEPTHSRARCPYCSTHDVEVMRKLRYARLVPVSEQAALEKEVLKEIKKRQEG